MLPGSFIPLLSALALGVALAPAAGSKPDAWPQYRGPRRDGVSAETGLMRSWPEAGPPVVWRKPIGEAFSSIAIVGDRLYTMGADPNDEYAVSLNAATGEEIWRAPLGERFEEEFGDGPRSSPVVDGDLFFALSSRGRLVALKSADGSKAWDVDLIAAFGGRVPPRGVSSTPLVDGDVLIVEGGGTEGKAIQGLDKRTGQVKWTVLNGSAGYSSGITVTVDGVRQDVFVRSSSGEIVALDQAGEVLWSHPWAAGAIAMPLFLPPNRIFASSSGDTGSTLVQIEMNGRKGAVKELWGSRAMKNHFNSSVAVGDHIYGFDNATLKCITAATGEQKWVQRGFGKGTLIAADGMLIILGDQGTLALSEATPDGYREKGRAQALTGKCWTSPALAGGRLYLRDQDEIVSLDLRPRSRAALMVGEGAVRDGGM